MKQIIFMKSRLFVILNIMFSLAFSMEAQQTRVYINPGHGSWGPNDRPMATIPYPMLSSTGRPDTCGFYESNTNLWKCEELAKRLQQAGYQIKMSRYANGPFPYVAGAADAEKYNKKLSVICAEVDAWDSDLFLSVHSNAASEGSTANYPLFLYRGYDSQELVSGSKAMAQAMWPYLVEAMKQGLENQTAYKTSTNIRGDINFYNSSSTTGYLGVLKHSTTGFLSEGYFHTYQPARHRALNRDWCRQEGLRYFRGIVAYCGTDVDTKGYILGVVKDKTRTMDGYSLYKYASGTHDAYLPVNGAQVRLRTEEGELVQVYDVDKNYNGVFSFFDLKPGTYYLDFKAPGYATQQGITNKIQVQANATTYPIIYMTPGISSDWEKVDGSVKVDVQGYGKVTLNGEVMGATANTKVEVGSKAVFTFEPEEGAYLESLTLNGENVMDMIVDNVLTIDKVSCNLNLVAVFKKYTYELSILCGSHGKLILPDTIYTAGLKSYTVEYDDSVRIAIQPDEGYEVKSVKWNGTNVMDDIVDNSYTIRNIKSNQKFQVTFTVATGIEKNAHKLLQVVGGKGYIKITGAKCGVPLSVMDTSGKVLYETLTDGTDSQLTPCATGVYVVSVGPNTFKVKVR